VRSDSKKKVPGDGTPDDNSRRAGRICPLLQGSGPNVVRRAPPRSTENPSPRDDETPVPRDCDRSHSNSTRHPTSGPGQSFARGRASTRISRRRIATRQRRFPALLLVTRHRTEKCLVIDIDPVGQRSTVPARRKPFRPDRVRIRFFRQNSSYRLAFQCVKNRVNDKSHANEFTHSSSRSSRPLDTLSLASNAFKYRVDRRIVCVRPR